MGLNQRIEGTPLFLETNIGQFPIIDLFISIVSKYSFDWYGKNHPSSFSRTWDSTINNKIPSSYSIWPKKDTAIFFASW